MRTLLVRFVVTLIAIFLVARVVPLLFPEMTPPIGVDDNVTLIIFALVLALVNAFIKPILKVLSLPITCITAGIFAIVLNLLMFFLAAWLTELLGRTVQVGWLGALIGAVVVALVGWVLNVILPDEWETR
jgi:putative membrane protein